MVLAMRRREGDLLGNAGIPHAPSNKMCRAESHEVNNVVAKICKRAAIGLRKVSQWADYSARLVCRSVVLQASFL